MSHHGLSPMRVPGTTRRKPEPRDRVPYGTEPPQRRSEFYSGTGLDTRALYETQRGKR